MPAAKLDWAAVKAEYVGSETPLSCTKLAAKYGVQRTTVARHMTAGHWVEERRLHRERVAVKTLDRASTIEAEIRARMLAHGRLLGDLGVARMGRLAREVQANPDAILKLSLHEARQLIETGSDLQKTAAGIAVPMEGAIVTTIEVVKHVGDGEPE